LKGKKSTYDHRIADYNVMREMRWTKADLDSTPECDVQSVMFITNRINIQAKLKSKKGGRGNDKKER